jgi:hypothetical protein
VDVITDADEVADAIADTDDAESRIKRNKAQSVAAAERGRRREFVVYRPSPLSNSDDDGITGAVDV